MNPAPWIHLAVHVRRQQAKPRLDHDLCRPELEVDLVVHTNVGQGAVVELKASDLRGFDRLNRRGGSVVPGEPRHAQRVLTVIGGIVRLTCANAFVSVGARWASMTLLPRFCHA